MVSLHSGCHHELCSLLHKQFGEKGEGEVVCGLLLGFSSVEEVGVLGRQQKGAVCAAAERIVLHRNMRDVTSEAGAGCQASWFTRFVCWLWLQLG